VVAEGEVAQPEPEPVLVEVEPEPEPELWVAETALAPEPVVAEVEPEPAPQPEEPAVSAVWGDFAGPEPLAAETPAPKPEPEPEPEPVGFAQPVSAAATQPPHGIEDVKSTMVAWPSTNPPTPTNGVHTQAFDEATSVIPAWQHSAAPEDSKRTVSLQAVPTEQITSGSGIAALLTFETGPFAGRIVAVPSQMISLGRAPDNDVVVGDPATSGHHTRIDVRGGAFWISDLGSTNGSLVNGEPVIEKQLSDGDLISIGQNTIRFTLEA
jgi:hypothetical protein